MRSSRLQKVAAGRGSRMCGARSSSSWRSSSDLRRKTMLLMVLTGELVSEANDARSVLLARDDVDDDDMDRRNDVRRLCGENRAVMDWKREDCMVPIWGWRVCLLRVGDVSLAALRMCRGVGGECKVVRHSLV